MKVNDYTFLTQPLNLKPVGIMFYVFDLDQFITAINNIITPAKLNIPLLYIGLCSNPNTIQTQEFKNYIRTFKSLFEGKWSADKHDSHVVYFSNSAYKGRLLSEKSFSSGNTARNFLF
jgi:hypothetical protein